MYIRYIKYFVIVLTILMFSTINVNAQDISTKEFATCSGTVVDDYGKPLKGVQINAAGNGIELTKTNDSGSFTISTPIDKKIIVYLKGFDKVEIDLSRLQQPLDIRLHRSFLAINDGSSALSDSAINGDVIYTLYGKSNGRSMLGSVSTISGNTLYGTPAPQYTYGLPGRLSGLNVSQFQGFYQASLNGLTDRDIFVGDIPKYASGSGPTDNNQFNIQLRGHGASYGQSPMVVIDGIQRELYSIDPLEIESVTVLKDALSSLLLGQNSSRGAIVVTTLQPKAGRPRLSFSAQTGFQESLKLPKPLSAYKYAYLLNEALQNEGKSPAYSDEDFQSFRNGSDPYRHPDVNWYNTILENNAPITRYNLNVTGGSNVARYMVSLGFLNQDGFFKTASSNAYNTNLQVRRYTINSKIDFNVNKDFTLGVNIIGRLENNNQPGAQTSNILNALLTTPNNAYPVYNPDGSYGGNTNYNNNLLSQVVASGYKSEQKRDILVNVDMKYNLDRWLKGWWVSAKGNVSVQSASFLDRSKQSPVFQMIISQSGDTSYNRYGTIVNQNNSFTSTSWARYWYAQASTGYDRQVGDHSFGAMLFYDQKQSLVNYDLPSVLTNYAFKGNYNYKQKYFVEGGLDYGGYSRYEPGHQYGMFYAAGIGWDVAQEGFIKENIRWINQLKFRGTYGRTGNNNVDYYGYYIWNNHFSDIIPSYPIGSNYPNTTGLQEQVNLPNVNATWEKAKKIDIGLDLSLFDNHLKGSFDYYHERYYDVMQSRGKSIALIGAGYPSENIGIDVYKGWEASLTYQNNTKDFNYFITGNASLQYSKVVFMDEQTQKYPWNIVTGLPVGQRFGLIADGFIQNAQEAATYPTISGYALKVGDLKYKDLNNDGVIDRFDLSPIGRTKPLLYYGLSTGFSYKGLELNFLIQGVLNRDMYVNNLPIDAGFQSQNNGYGQAYEQIQGRWTPETANSAIYPRLTAGGNGYNSTPLYSSNTYFLHNGNYLRLKNAEIAYTLPYQWLKRFNVGSVRIFVNALNLFTWSAYGQVDPEISLSNYPMQRVINTGINIKL